MGGVKRQRQPLMLAGGILQPHFGFRHVGGSGQLQQNGGNGQQTVMVHHHVQDHIVSPLNGFAAEITLNRQRSGSLPYADESEKDQQHKQQRRHEKQGASRGKCGQQQGKNHHCRQGQMHFHSFTGTVTFLRIFISTSSAAMPFIRASGFSTSR